MKQLCNLCVGLESSNLRVMPLYYRSTRSLRNGLSEVACSFSSLSFLVGQRVKISGFWVNVQVRAFDFASEKMIPIRTHYRSCLVSALAFLLAEKFQLSTSKTSMKTLLKSMVANTIGSAFSTSKLKKWT
jgi:hypothetical protein